MHTHKNSLLTPKGREQLVHAVLTEGMTKAATARRFKITTKTVAKWISRYHREGKEGLRDRSSRPKSLTTPDASSVRDKLFEILHCPPSQHGFNRTSWKLDDLHQTLVGSGVAIGKHAMRREIKAAGFQWKKARRVLTSQDPEYRHKLDEIHNILSQLSDTDAFFSIDEFGPFTIKKIGGKKLVAPNDYPTFPQRQKPKGILIVTAAVELRTNQVTHFYSEKKNTDEMIKLLDALLEKYNRMNRIYLSWDAVSWHVSKKLFDRIESNNVMADVTGSTRVELAPLPSGAQFLNVIEAIFSGMARAVLHNSDYNSADQAKNAIDRYFEDRNLYYTRNPKKAGKKIWGGETCCIQFSESHNCKDPRYR